MDCGSSAAATPLLSATPASNRPTVAAVPRSYANTPHPPTPTAQELLGALARRRSAGFPACGFTGLSSPVFRAFASRTCRAVAQRRRVTFPHSTFQHFTIHTPYFKHRIEICIFPGERLRRGNKLSWGKVAREPVRIGRILKIPPI